MRVERIERLDDPRVADYRDLREAELRDGSGRFVVEGRLGVERLLARVVGYPMHRGCLAAAQRGPELAASELLARGCADPLYRKSVRVSMGGALSVPWAWAEGGAALAEQLRAHGLCVLALAPEPGGWDVREIAALCAGRATALLLGSEGPGLSAGALARADASVRIAMAAGVDSLNVATASAIALHHLARLDP